MTPRRSSPARIGAAAGVAGLAAILILLLGGWQILQTRDALLAAAERDAQTLTRSLAQHAARTIDGIDITLSGVTERLQADPEAAGLAASLSRRTGRLGQLRRIAVTDGSGQWIADSLPPHEPRSSAALPEFAWHRDHPSGDLHFEAMRHGRFDGALVIPVSKRWTNPDGSFAGIVSAGLTPDYFAAFYRTVQIGRQGTVGLFSDDGHFLIRYPQLPGFEQSAASFKLMSTIFASRSGMIRAVSPNDGVERIFAFEHVDAYPLVVSSAISVDEALSSWRRQASIEGGVMGIAVLALFSLGTALERHRRRLLLAMRQAAEQSALLQTTLDNMDQALVKVSADGTIELFNRRFAEVFSTALPLLGDPRSRFDDIVALLAEAGQQGEPGRTPRTHVAGGGERGGGEPLALGTCEVSRPDGTILEVRTVATPDGAVVRTYADVTARHEAERARRESEDRYRLLADNSSDMITQMDLTGRRLFVSPGSRELVGYEPEELVGTSRADFVHPDDEPGLRRKIEDLVAGRTKRVANINRIRHKEGWWIWIEASVKLMRDAEGRPCGLVSALRDVTDRKVADEAVRQSEERYRLLADNSSDMITLKSSFAGPRPYVSPSVFAMTGYTADEFAALPPSQYVHPDDGARVAAEFAALTPDRPQARSLHRARHKAGAWMWVETDFRLIEAGAPGRTVLVRSRDVTVRHEAELALATSEARYRVLAETTSDLITQLDLSMERRYVSPACRHVLGFEPEELLGRRPSADIHPEDAHDARALAARLVAGEVEGDRAVTTYRTRHKAGHWLWVEAGLNLIRDEATGAPTSLICSLRDVTERQRAARHLERAKAEAEAAARAKAEFVANMSHELRTPLTGIIGVHDLLRADPNLTAAQRRLAELAGDAGRSLLTIVNDVLDFSKVDAGQLVLERVPFDLDDLAASCCDLARGQLDGKPVALSTLRGTRPLGWFAGDPTRVRQVLLNLLTNAVKFTERGAITVDAIYQDATGLLRVEVADTGIGVPPDRIGGLFDRFTQADTSTTRRYGGTGLGLAICKRLTDLMSGSIGVEARAGGGSTFWFELPMTRSEGRLATRVDEPPVPVAAAGRSLLLAEDNAVNAEIVAAMLAGRGYRVSIVRDGAAAVRAVRGGADAFDLILMDLQMPVMDGLGATAAIRAHEVRAGGSRLPIVGLTANALAEDAALCLAAGMDAHVAKPIDWTRLFAVLDGLLGPETEATPGGGHAAAEGMDVLDMAKLDSLAALIGRDRLGGMVARFVEDLRVRMTAALSGDEAELSRAVHVLVSSAGQLGFRELSALCAEAEAGLRSGAGFDRTDELRSAADRAAAAAARSGFTRVA